MKVFANIVKVLTALATVAGAIYIVATYGEQIVAWAKKVLSSLPCPKCEPETEVKAEAAAEVPVTQEPAAEEAPVEEPAAEVAVEETEPVAEEADFAE